MEESANPPSFTRNKLSDELGISKKDVDKYLRILHVKAGKIQDKLTIKNEIEQSPAMSKKSSSLSPSRMISSKRSSSVKEKEEEYVEGNEEVDKLSNCLLLKKKSSNVNLGQIIKKLD